MQEHEPLGQVVGQDVPSRIKTGPVVRDPAIRAQEMLDGAEAIRENFGYQAVIPIEDGNGGVKYELIRRGSRTDRVNGQSPRLRTKSVVFGSPIVGSAQEFPFEQGMPKEPKPQPKSNKPNLAGFTGFYKGTYYVNGAGQLKKRRG